jgi:galactokinase
MISKYPDLDPFLQQIQQITGDSQFFKPDHKIFISRSPGRMDLMGGNDDYTGGLVFEITIQEATMVAVQRRSDQKIVILNPQTRGLPSG